MGHFWPIFERGWGKGARNLNNPILFQNLNAKGIASGGMLKLRTVSRIRDFQRCLERFLQERGSLYFHYNMSDSRFAAECLTGVLKTFFYVFWDLLRKNPGQQRIYVFHVVKKQKIVNNCHLRSCPSKCALIKKIEF